MPLDNLKVGDLLQITSASRPIVTELGIFLGMEHDWKKWYRVLIRGEEQTYDEPYWELKVINKV